MKSTIIVSAALVAAATADSVGSAVVLNKCSEDVYLYNTPSSDGGYSEVDKVLSTGDSYTQQWTELSNGNGWSMKLSNSTSLVDILQYEYTYQGDSTIWYDLSEVNGNPWDGNWEITSNTDTCDPRQAAYRYATDNAYGEQSCPSDSTITVTLCSGSSDDESSSSSSSSASSTAESTAESSAASSTIVESSATASTTAEYTPASTTTAEASTTVASSTSSPATTLQTSVLTTSSASNEYDVVVTVTEITTATAWAEAWTPKKREAHQHHAARHPHHRN